MTQKTEAAEKIPIKKKSFGIINETGITNEYINIIIILYFRSERFIPANENQEIIVSQPIIK